ncbi:MAG: hypothetical protein SPL34_06180 [Selenomonadaceae bacterium]|uniref:GntT/GntP/DsdX family permease n=1 Tax=Selenomonas bovis TaxID=416586 RepID=UPI0022B0636C|nr:hypothetical protein [Selenomonas bovis]MDY6272786.1 hypothetical protein [Selenomonadaceae bacterium]MDY6299175.1 hypothetical protein [Selenomonadaceae bacterium]
MAITGFLVSIQIFCNSGFIILTPLAKAISSEMRKSIVSIGIALACGLVITHTMVPATPGPVGVAGIFEVNVGSLIFWGLVLAVPMLIGPILFACWGARKSGRFPRRRATGRVNSFFWGAIARSASRRAGSSCGSTRWPARSPGPSASSSC